MTALANLLWLALRLFVFIFIFVIDVRVKAAESVRLPSVKADQLIQQPHACFQNFRESCALATGDRQKFLLEMPGAKVWLDQNTAVVRVGAAETATGGSEIRLLKGIVWVQAKKTFRVSSEFGVFYAPEPVLEMAKHEAGSDEPNLHEDAEFWIRRETDRVIGSALVSELHLLPFGSTVSLVVPENLENWMGRVDHTGRATTGVPLPVSFGDQVQRMARLFPGKVKDFEKKVESFHQGWLQGVELSAGIHQAAYQRKVASIPDPVLVQTKPVSDPVVDRRRRFNEMINAFFRKKFFSGE